MRDKARSNRVVKWSGDYHGRPHRFRLQPIEAFRDCPWLIVTFQEVTPVLSRELIQQTDSLRLGGLNLLLVVVLAFGFAGRYRYRHRRVRDLMQTMLSEMTADIRWIKALIGLAVLEFVMIVVTWYLPVPPRLLDVVYLVFVATPVASLAVAFLSRRQRHSKDSTAVGMEAAKEEKEKQAKNEEYRGRLAVIEVGLLVLLIGALPAIGFARVAAVARQASDTERWLGLVQQQWTARSMRVAERIKGPNYTTELETRLKEDFGAGRFDAHGRYTYLNALDGVSVEENPNAPVDSLGGSGLVRWLLDLNVFSSSDGPIDPAAQRSISSHVLSVGPSEHWRGGTVEGLSGVSGVGIVIGMSIFAASMTGMYWVRGKLRSSGSAAAPSLEETIRNAPKTGHVVALVIGPARAAKDAEVCRVVKEQTHCEPIDRIRLLDPKATVNKEYLENEVNRVTQTIKWRARVGKLQTPFWVHVSNLETQLVDEESRTVILNVLDRLLNAVPERRGCLVVTSTIDPIEHFDEIFLKERKGIYTNPVPEVALNRSVLILSFFRRCYMPISPRVGSVERCKDAWDSWWHYSPKDWRVTLAAETREVTPLEQVREELMSAWCNREEVPFDELVRTIRARAMAYYQLIWTSCTRSEKLVLIQLAQEGFVTTQSTDVVAPLIAKGIIVERPTPAIFNLTFRDFLIDIERDDVVQRWERGEGHGLWVVSGRRSAAA